MQWKIQRATGDCQFEKVQTSGARVAPRAPYRNSVEGRHVIYIWINRKAAERVPFSISITSPKQKDQLKLRNWNSSRSSTMSTIIPNTGHPFAGSSNAASDDPLATDPLLFCDLVMLMTEGSQVSHVFPRSQLRKRQRD